MKDPRYILIESEGNGPPNWRGVKNNGEVVCLSATGIDWSDYHLIVVPKWGGKQPLLARLTGLAAYLDTSIWEYRVFLHPGGTSLRDRMPRQWWADSAGCKPLRSALTPGQWARFFSHSGGCGEGFSKKLVETSKLCSDSATASLSLDFLQELDNAWADATRFFSLKPALLKALDPAFCLVGSKIPADDLQQRLHGYVIKAKEVEADLFGDVDITISEAIASLEKLRLDPLNQGLWVDFLKFQAALVT